jgi:hypothetical protein
VVLTIQCTVAYIRYVNCCTVSFISLVDCDVDVQSERYRVRIVPTSRDVIYIEGYAEHPRQREHSLTGERVVAH